MNIIELAKKWEWLGTEGWTFNTEKELQAFADLVAAHEREACAKVCETSDRYRGDYFAAAIRARGTT